MLQVPVELTLPNEALDGDIVGLSQDSQSTEWTEGNTKIKCFDEQTVTLLIAHFTRFKLSTRSRIPVMVSINTHHHICDALTSTILIDWMFSMRQIFHSLMLDLRLNGVDHFLGHLESISMRSVPGACTHYL